MFNFKTYFTALSLLSLVNGVLLIFFPSSFLSSWGAGAHSFYAALLADARSAAAYTWWGVANLNMAGLTFFVASSPEKYQKGAFLLTLGSLAAGVYAGYIYREITVMPFYVMLGFSLWGFLATVLSK